MCHCEAHCLSQRQRLMTQSLPRLVVSVPLDHFPILVLGKTGPRFSDVLECSVIGKALLNRIDICPEVARCQATVAAVPNATQEPVHLLVRPNWILV